MLHRLFLIVCILILTACQPAAAPIPTETAATATLLPTATATLVVPTITPTSEPSPTLKPPAKPIELKPVLITEAGKGFDFTAAASQYPELDSALQKVLTEKLQLAKNKAPDRQKSISIAIGTDENEIKFLWVQAGEQPLVAQASNGYIFSPAEALAKVQSIESFIPLIAPANPQVPAGEPAVPLYIRSYAVQEDHIVGLDTASKVVAEFIPGESSWGQWNLIESDGAKTSLQTVQESQVEYFSLNIPITGDGQPNFEVSLDKLPHVSKEKVSSTNLPFWFNYYFDLLDAYFPVPTGAYNPTGKFSWGPSDAGLYYLMVVQGIDLSNNGVLQNMAFPGINLDYQDPESREVITIHMFPMRIKTDKGHAWLPILISDWEYQIMLQHSRLSFFNKRDTLRIIAFNSEILAETYKRPAKEDADMMLLDYIRGLPKELQPTEAELRETRKFIEDYFSVPGYRPAGYSPRALPASIRFLFGDVGFYY